MKERDLKEYRIQAFRYKAENSRITLKTESKNIGKRQN
jgi:hypothetical protein